MLRVWKDTKRCSGLGHHCAVGTVVLTYTSSSSGVPTDGRQHRPHWAADSSHRDFRADSRQRCREAI